MVPSAAPMILLFAMITRKQSNGAADGGNPGLRIALFTSAYVLIWGAFSLVATLAQWGLTEAALLTPMMVGNSRWLLVALLLAAPCSAPAAPPLRSRGRGGSALAVRASPSQPGLWGKSGRNGRSLPSCLQ